MYSIEFTGQAGEGLGTLILDGGRIFGADVAGGTYDGNYQYNEATDLVDVNIRIQMPANRLSVTGIVQPFEWILEVSAEMDPKEDSAQIRVRTNTGQPIVATYRFLRALPMVA